MCGVFIQEYSMDKKNLMDDSLFDKCSPPDPGRKNVGLLNHEKKKTIRDKIKLIEIILVLLS